MESSESDDLVNEIVGKYKDLNQRYQTKCKQYNDEFEARGHYQERAREAQKWLTEFEHHTDANCFAFAIIDGDGAVFREDLIARGEDGGTLAAHQLRTSIKQYLKREHPDSNVESWHIIVQVSLNLGGAVAQARPRRAQLPAFAHAFGRAHGLFALVDVGFGKKQADFKVREMLRVMAKNVQCKHVIVGPCHDKGYMVELKPYQLDEAAAAKLTLLETTPVPFEFQELGFKIVAFPEVFRSEPLPAGKAPLGGISNLRTLSPNAPTQSPTPADLPNTPPGWSAVSISLHNERVDEPLQRYDGIYDQRFSDRMRKEGRKPCNRYHLHNKCDNPSCAYYHGERLCSGELLVLQHKAHGTMCFKQQWCKDVNCLLGHHCKFGDKCRWDCKFGATHDMKLTPAEKVFEDGSRVSL
ncbi:Uu.00g028110.m01.CDS01 [Anthostomella pinea]|uniref:Uu.00g028110.m01.CDS01 n=1 Tax=Anthostomella pinea TaxID=933095 RepID=A0AAI8V314_9PEZI|nr:Uu.00g028110.m01.CDS01 [Anthostomella pinea]